ncbi:MAG: aminopeptidase P family protein [Methanomicrobiales archaeon]|nr:aminopeptidase P family protein [Methanomicrobiales archaeon]NYT21346.1 aminopeptidase P family protein [Methanomicrobiales archaeon]
MDALDKSMEECGADAYVLIGSSENADMRYLTRFLTTDPVVYIRKRGGNGTIIVSQMEYERAVREAAVPAMSRAEAGFLKILEEEKDRWRALARMIAEYVEGPVLVPPTFPYALGTAISAYCPVHLDPGTVGKIRSVKSRDEIARIRRVQRATEMAMGLAVDLIRRSKPRGGLLYLGRSQLTSERIRLAMHELLRSRGCLARETIVSCGEDTATPHLKGSGPLREGEPIVIDIFPRDEESGYYSDMTRTVSKGKPATEIREMYAAVRDAQDQAAVSIRAGADGSAVHLAVVDLFKERGYTSGLKGFTHNLGHGVGLEVHELPSLGPGGETLEAGNVVTNEPGLYYPGTGGVRIENIGVVTRKGFRCLTRFPRELVV